ncbi:RrF2 family transcriptional regulator [Streptomyces coeruleorubidus]|uniref:RrF2 family transcriptional regulator n=1 Tax=Streptomyces coeruleorubidus TaxID=116188 RepID=UPI0037020BFF
MRIPARADHAVRAVVEPAVRQGEGPVEAETVATARDIPHTFPEGILGDLRRGGAVGSRRGGRRPAREAAEITVADVIRAVDGPIVSVRGERPTGLARTGTAEPLLPLWTALRRNRRPGRTRDGPRPRGSRWVILIASSGCPGPTHC